MWIIFLAVDWIKILIYLFVIYKLFCLVDKKFKILSIFKIFISNISSVRCICFIVSIIIWLFLNFIMHMNLILSVTIGISVNMFLPSIILSFTNSSKTRKKIVSIEEFVVSMMVSLKSGMTLIGSISNSVNSISDSQVKKDLESIVINYNLGLSVEESVQKLYTRKNSQIYQLVFNPILICLSYGGNLVTILEKISELLSNKKEIEQKLYSLTSQVRIQSFILLVVSPAIFVGYFFFDRRMFFLLCSTTIGHVVITLAFVLELLGFFFIRKMMNFTEKEG